MNCILIIACLVAGFLLGRMGSKACYDGIVVLGSDPDDFQIRLTLDEEDLPRCRVLMLKVVKEG